MVTHGYPISIVIIYPMKPLIKLESHRAINQRFTE